MLFDVKRPPNSKRNASFVHNCTRLVLVSFFTYNICKSQTTLHTTSEVYVDVAAYYDSYGQVALSCVAISVAVVTTLNVCKIFSPPLSSPLFLYSPSDCSLRLELLLLLLGKLDLSCKPQIGHV